MNIVFRVDLEGVFANFHFLDSDTFFITLFIDCLETLKVEHFVLEDRVVVWLVTQPFRVKLALEYVDLFVEHLELVKETTRVTHRSNGAIDRKGLLARVSAQIILHAR